MAKKWYIKHTDVEMPDNGLAYFGPFNSIEIETRINDALADSFASSGMIEVVRLPFWKRWGKYINPREWWLKELMLMERRHV